MEIYDHKKIEQKWQAFWEKEGLYTAADPEKSSAKKFYSLIEFPYPSGDGLHVGHPRPYIGMDVISRKRRMEGYNVLYPIGWDAFGLPTENYAIKTGKDPRVVTKENSDTFRRQIQSLGVSFDWSREINTTDPKYYKWTQWIFLQFLKAGLAYKKKMTINWCPKDLIGLANEEVIDGKCERCGTAVEKREKEQWMLAITKYAERLDRDLDDVDYLPQIKTQQRNWIGKSEGAEINFLLDFKKNPKDNDNRGPHGERAQIKVFTTRPDTLYGVTYIVLSPEHPWVTLATDAAHDVLLNKEEVIAYIKSVKTKPEMERTAAATEKTGEKTGVELKGVKAVNPATGEEIPMWIADYVLADYGTGAVMAVPAHDERDWDFAKKYDLPIREVVMPWRVDVKNPPQAGKKEIERKTVHALVIDPANGKILCIKWKKFPWTGFVVGGVDEGEDIVAAARREILEETGYKNLKYVRVLGGQVRGEYFAAHKGENRVAISNAILFELENHDRAPIAQEEIDKHEVIWLDPKTLRHDNFTCAELDLLLERMATKNEAYTGEGILVNSGKFTSQTSAEVKKAITESAGGTWVTKFKLRDWIFSRQRYWGEPIPVVHCEKCGIVPLPEKDLPLMLPEVNNYKPTETGESPLAAIEEWVNTSCPQCAGPARRETDTMPNWAGSSWYYLRYIDTENDQVFASPEKLKYWTPVDWYNGGMEHTTLHLLYSRFWHKFLFDQGLVPTKEPYQKRTSHGLILAKGGEKMSKSKGNVVNPDGIVAATGADALRLYEMFMGPFDQAIAWDENGIVGCRRFIERVWKMRESVSPVVINENKNHAHEIFINKTIKKVSEDIEEMRFNTAVSTLMIAVNELEKGIKKEGSEGASISADHYEILLSLLAPFAPHVTEEIWQDLYKGKNPKFISIHTVPWPVFDPTNIKDATVVIPVQINGKTRATVQMSPDASEEDVKNMALSLDEIKKWTGRGDGNSPEGSEKPNIKKVIYVKGRLLNLVIDLTSTQQNDTTRS